MNAPCTSARPRQASSVAAGAVSPPAARAIQAGDAAPAEFFAEGPAPAPTRAVPRGLAPSGPDGPFGRELDCDTPGPALQATLDYRMREGVAAQSALLLDHAPRQRLAVGYGGTLLASLIPPDASGCSALRLIDLTAPGLTPPQRSPRPHPQALGFGLTDAVPLGRDGAVPPPSVLLARFADSANWQVELLRCAFTPGDQRPQAMVVRRRLLADQAAANPWRVDWVDLKPLWQPPYLPGKTARLDELPHQTLLAQASAPQVLTNAGGDDAGGCFVLVDGPTDVVVGPFGALSNARVQLLRAYFPGLGGAAAAPLTATGNLVPRALRAAGAPLHAVACSPGGVVAYSLADQVRVVSRLEGAPAVATFVALAVPRPAAWAERRGVVCDKLALAARGRFLAASWRAADNVAAAAEWRAGLFACDYRRTRQVVPIELPLTPGCDASFVDVALIKTDLDEDDAAKLCSLDEAQATQASNTRLVQAARRLFLTDAPRTQVHVAISFANFTQIFALEYEPASHRATDDFLWTTRPLAQTFAADDAGQAWALGETNGRDARRIFSTGAARVVVQADVSGDMYPRFYAQQDQERDNGRLSGGLLPIVVRETRPAVVTAARAAGRMLRENKVTMGPWMSRDGRFLFAGLDGNRLQRWDFAPGENGHLPPGVFAPQLQPYFQRPRTPAFAPTPAGRHVAAQSFAGHVLPLPDEVLGRRQRQAYWWVHLEERPHVPPMVGQDVLFAQAADADGEEEGLLAPPDLQPVSWGSGVGEMDAVTYHGQHLLSLSASPLAEGPEPAPPVLSYGAPGHQSMGL